VTVSERYDATALATRMHLIYEGLAPQFGYTTRTDTRKFDPESPNGKLMIATVSELVAPLLSDIAALTEENARQAAIIRNLEAAFDRTKSEAKEATQRADESRAAFDRRLDKEFNQSDKLKDANARLAATVREMEGKAEDLRGALEDAEKAMNYLGDILNNHDMVEDADIEFTAPLFERVQRTLGREYAPAADEREG
jgi:hypothetical protein